MYMRKMHCPLGNHLLRGAGLYITNPRHISFINKYFPDYLPSERVCAKCKRDIAIAYEYKMRRALNLRAKNASLISSSTTDDTPPAEANRQEKRNTQERSADALSSASSSDDDRPTTSAQAAAKRKRKEELQRKRMLAINVQRGVRLPHIQPAPRRRQFVYANPDIMDIYLRGTTGG